MRIGIDGGSWSNRRGYGRFLREVAQALSRLESEHRFVIFLDAASSRTFTPLPGFTVREVKLAHHIAEAATDSGNRSPADLLRMGRAVAGEPLDVFFFPTVYSWFPVWKRVPIVVGIHDTIADRNPRFAFAGRKQELLWKAKVRLALAQSRLVLTVSEYSRRCLQEHYGVAPERMRVVPEAASASFRSLPNGPDREKMALYAGGISPNKNLGTLVRAFAKLENEREAGWRLVLAGDFQSDGFKSCYQEIRTLVEDLGLRDQVEFPGYVTDEKLASLYQQAGLFILPSFDEGFGLPAIEAMASGTPVIVSEGNALVEVVGSAGLSFPVRDIEALAAAMRRVLGDAELRRTLSEAGIRRAAEFSWDQTARALLHVLGEALSR